MGRIVASRSFENQTQNVSFNFFDPSDSGGLYKLYVYLSVNNTTNSGNAGWHAGWTDKMSGQAFTTGNTVPWNGVNVVPFGVMQQEIIVQLKGTVDGGTSLHLGFGDASGNAVPSGSSYNAYARLESIEGTSEIPNIVF